MPIRIVRQDIVNIECDAIVDPSNESLVADGGVDAAIHAAAGASLARACRRLGGVSVGQAKLTRGYKLPCRYVIHTAGPRWEGGGMGEEELLRSCYRECLALARERGCESVAFPLISSGLGGFPRDRVLRIAMDEIARFLVENEMLVYIALYDKESFSIGERLAEVTAFIDDAYVERRESPREEIERRRMAYSLPDDDRISYRIDACECIERDVRLDDMLRNLDRGFAETLFHYIDEKGLTDVECYKRANVDKKTFSKIKCNPDYRPSKITAVSFAIALRLDLDETRHLLNTVGLSLSRSSKFDVIIEYFVTTGNYKDIFDVNETLYQLDQVMLGV